MTSFNSNSPANGFISAAVDSDEFYLRGSDYDGYSAQYMAPYPRYHQPYPSHRFDGPGNLTPPQPDRTSPCDLPFFNGTPRYPTHSYETHNLYNNHQNYYQHANAMPPYRAEATNPPETIDFDSCKMISPAFTPPGSSQYPVVASQSADSSPSDSGVSTSPTVGQKTVPNTPESVYPWMKANASK